LAGKHGPEAKEQLAQRVPQGQTASRFQGIRSIAWQVALTPQELSLYRETVRQIYWFCG